MDEDSTSGSVQDVFVYNNTHKEDGEGPVYTTGAAAYSAPFSTAMVSPPSPASSYLAWDRMTRT